MPPEPRIRHRKDRDTYQVIYYEGGERRFRTFATLEEAEGFRDRPKDSDREGLPPPGGPRVADALPLYLRARGPHMAPSTLRTTAGRLAALAKAYPDTQVKAFSVPLAEDHLADLIRQGKAKTTVNTMRVIYIAFWNWLISREMALDNPWARTRPFKVARHAPPLVPVHLVADYLAACTKTFRPMAALGIYAGLRRREVLELQWTDVDLEEGWVRLRDTKAHKPRIIPIHPDLGTILRALPKTAFLVFPSPRGGGARCLDAHLSRMARTAGRRVGLERVTFHGLRATCATLLATAGAGETIIRDILGHHSTEVTRVYLAPGPRQLQEAMARVQIEPECARPVPEVCPLRRGED